MMNTEWDIISASELAELPMPSEEERLQSMIDRLLHAPSCVRFGDWKYDRVPSSLVTELLGYLHDRLREVGE